MQKIFLGGKYGSVIGNYALVDDEDFEKLSQYNWYCEFSRGVYYARTNITSENKRQPVRMHHFLVTDIGENLKRDHKDGNGLNNQKNNIRIATHSQNTANRTKQGGTSKYLGVSWYSRHNKWVATMSVNKKSKTIGYFEKEEDAAKAYNEMALKHHGEFAKLNIITDDSEEANS